MWYLIEELSDGKEVHQTVFKRQDYAKLCELENELVENLTRTYFARSSAKISTFWVNPTERTFIRDEEKSGVNTVFKEE